MRKRGKYESKSITKAKMPEMRTLLEAKNKGSQSMSTV